MARASWHQTEISKGVFGELSKVAEELAELADTIEQGQPVMTLIELSDIVGAVDGVLARHGSSVEDAEHGALGSIFRADSASWVVAHLNNELERAQAAESKGDTGELIEALRDLVGFVCFYAAGGFNVDFAGLLRFARLRSAIILDELQAD